MKHRIQARLTTILVSAIGALWWVSDGAGQDKPPLTVPPQTRNDNADLSGLPVITRVNIPMALTDLEPGTLITEAHIGMGPALTDKLDRDVLRTTRVVIGRVVKNRIARAQPILTTDLEPSLSPTSLPYRQRVMLRTETGVIKGTLRLGTDGWLVVEGNDEALVWVNKDHVVQIQLADEPATVEE